MITFKDIEKIRTVMKEYFYTKEETDDKFADLKRTIELYQTTALGQIQELRQQRDEIKILIHNMLTVQKWAKPVSEKTGVEYPF